MFPTTSMVLRGRPEVPFHTGTMNRQNDGPPTRAATLAWQLLRLGAWGVQLRASNQCAGGIHLCDLDLAGTEIRFRELTSRARHRGVEARAASHARRGHDRGCAALGLPLAFVDNALHEWDQTGAQPLMMEAVTEAVSEIGVYVARTQHWAAGDATEALTYAVERRISPLPPRPGHGGIAMGSP